MRELHKRILHMHMVHVPSLVWVVRIWASADVEISCIPEMNRLESVDK